MLEKTISFYLHDIDKAILDIAEDIKKGYSIKKVSSSRGEIVTYSSKNVDLGKFYGLENVTVFLVKENS